MRKKIAAALAVMVVASACLTACSKADMDAATGETATAETATGETAAIEYDLGLDDDGYITHTPFTKESFAARYPGKPYSEAANLEMLKFFEQI